GALDSTDAGGHFASAHALECHVLIFQHMVDQYPVRDAEGRNGRGPPGQQAVGVERDAQSLGQAVFVQFGNLPLQVALQQANLLNMVEQTLAQIRWLWRRATQQDRLTDARLQQFDALRNGRLRQPQRLRRALEAGLLDNRRQSGKQL